MRTLTLTFFLILATITSQEKYEFQAEISKLLDILINSLYTQKEIFLREAISNASDALDKARFLSVSDPRITEAEAELSIKIEADTENKRLIITDTGIGMTKQDLINNLGTIAKSGTKQFLDALKSGGNLSLIGQFGVGFYSYFLVADRVTVVTKNVDDDQYIWESDAQSSFTITEDKEGPFIKRGTRIILHLKENAEEFLEINKLKEMVKKYSEFINFPIYLYTSREVSKEIEDEEEIKEETETKDDLKIEDADEPVLDEEHKKKTKTVTETVWDWEQLNENKALWLRPIDEIEDEEYKNFYKALSKDHEDPLDWIHFKTEGDVEFRALLFIPKTIPFNFLDPEAQEKKASVKLYVRRVLISEDFEELLPRYLNFIKGVVDSDDLPLNVSRETLQQMKIIKTIKKKLVKKIIDKLSKYSKLEIEEDYKKNEEGMTEEEKKELEERIKTKKNEIKEKYEKFWSQFGRSIKLGIIEDISNRNKLAEISRFYSTYDNAASLTSFDDYISRFKSNQDSIYYLAGDDRNVMLDSPLLKQVTKKGYEVLILDDPIDEYTVQTLGKYKSHSLTNIAKSGFQLPQEEDEKELMNKITRYYQPLMDWLKNTLSEHIQKVNVGLNLEDPMVVLANESGYSAQMEKIAKAQAMAYKDDRLSMLQSMKKNLVINPYHPFIKEMLERVKAGPDADAEESAKLLLEVAMLNSGFSLKNPTTFSNKFYKIMSDSLGLSRDEHRVEIDFDEFEAESASGNKEEAIGDLDIGNANDVENEPREFGNNGNIDTSGASIEIGENDIVSDELRSEEL